MRCKSCGTTSADIMMMIGDFTRTEYICLDCYLCVPNIESAPRVQEAWIEPERKAKPHTDDQESLFD